jgi:hypothetical protein
MKSSKFRTDLNYLILKVLNNGKFKIHNRFKLFDIESPKQWKVQNSEQAMSSSGTKVGKQYVNHNH